MDSPVLNLQHELPWYKPLAFLVSKIPVLSLTIQPRMEKLVKKNIKKNISKFHKKTNTEKKTNPSYLLQLLRESKFHERQALNTLNRTS